MPGAGGLGTLADHQASLERQLGRSVAVGGLAEADPPVCPKALEYLLGWFTDLALRRSGGAVGPNPISYHDIESWARLHGRELSRQEVRVLVRLDDAALASGRPEKTG